MYYHVDRNFPDVRPDIEALANRDLEFATLLADFEALSTWLATHEPAASSTEAEFNSAVELVQDLKNEIRSKLEEYDEHNR